MPRQCYKIEFYVPETHIEKVKEALFEAGAGKIGNYDHCAWQTEGTGQFRPLPGSNPFIGTNGELEKVAEWKVELICEENLIETAIAALRKAHPYETPAYQYWKLNT
ncbi:MAG: NGG1p interacting factor NIF3 [Lentisphaerae bacterium GWF2_52_8]|nr:MAG: NGG1p interacting factor NIF3 [Lentisphaerae bacterium GWF2_52_8]